MPAAAQAAWWRGSASVGSYEGGKPLVLLRSWAGACRWRRSAWCRRGRTGRCRRRPRRPGGAARPRWGRTRAESPLSCSDLGRGRVDGEDRPGVGGVELVDAGGGPGGLVARLGLGGVVRGRKAHCHAPILGGGVSMAKIGLVSAGSNW